MELEVLHHRGIPESGIISIRAGSTRRQAQLSALDRPFKFPNKPEEVSTFKVDILDLKATARLAYDPSEMEYNLTLDPPGADAQGGCESTQPDQQQQQNADVQHMEVSFRVRPSHGTTATEAGEAPTSPQEADQRDAKKEVAARSYLEKHGLTTFMQFLMQSLMKDKPANPYSFLQKQVTKRMVTEVSKNVTVDKMDLLLEDDGLDTLLSQFSGNEANVDVTTEQLAQLERDAAVASEQLRADNARLREVAAELKQKYESVLKETAELEKSIPAGVGEATLPAMPPAQPGESPQMSAYREIAQMQDEITMLARENAALVSQLASMRTTIDNAYGEIEDPQKLVPG